MRFLKRSARSHPRLSLVLLDWGVRESFHLLHYLKTQSVPRDAFEVVLIEYYGKVSEPLKPFESEVDTWVLLEMPPDCYYHKHVMYNAGILFSRGGLVAFADSDAMVRPAFVETILKAFEADPLIVYHMDEFRNVRRDFYPFNYPSFEDVLGEGCINRAGNRTKGIDDEIDPVHSRNYGACMCAARSDVIAIGGADESLTYLGHICGPYDMTFRLMNYGRRLVWETEEYLYHTWHPGSDGSGNYIGPHDGRHMSTTAFQALCTGRVPPRVENRVIQRLRTGSTLPEAGRELRDLLIDPSYLPSFKQPERTASPAPPLTSGKGVFASYHSFDVYQIEEAFYGFPTYRKLSPQSSGWRENEFVIRGSSFSQVRETIDRLEPQITQTIGPCDIWLVDGCYGVVPHSLGSPDLDLWSRAQRENPAIEWRETEEDAAQVAQRIASSAATMNGRGNTQTESPEMVRVLSEIDALEQRMSGLESSVSGIYESRTWKALVGGGAILQRAMGIGRGPERGGK